MQIEQTFVVNAPPDAVWEYLTESRNAYED